MTFLMSPEESLAADPHARKVRAEVCTTRPKSGSGFNLRLFTSPIKLDEIGADRLRAELAQHHRHLSAMIRAVVDDVLEHLPIERPVIFAVQATGVLQEFVDAVLAKPR